METVQQYNERFMRENPQYGYNPIATSDINSNIAKSQPSYQGGELMPATGTAAYNDALALAKLAPTNFRAEIPTNIPSDGVAPINTSSNLTSEVDADRNRLTSYLTPSTQEGKVIDDLASVRAEIMTTNSAKRDAIDALDKNPQGMSAEQLQAEKLRIEGIYDRRLADLSTREANSAKTLQAYQNQRSGNLEAERVMQSYDTAKANRANVAIDNYASSLAKDPLPTLEQIQNMSDTQLLNLTSVRKGIEAGYDLSSIKTDLANAAALRGEESRYKSAQVRSLEALAEKREKGESEDVSFTDANYNKGALRSGMSIDSFKKLDPEVQNYFINIPESKFTAMSEAISNVKSGDEDAQDVKDEIDASLSLSENVKAYLKAQVDAVTPIEDTESGWGEIWSGIKNLFK